MTDQSARYEAAVNNCLAEIFVKKLKGVLTKDGFTETLRIPNPDITEFQRDSHVLSLRLEHAQHGNRLIVVEGADVEVDVEKIVSVAVRETMLHLADELLGFFPNSDQAKIRREADELLERLLPPD